MIINTKFFGEIECDENEILYFPFGIYGFEEHHRFALIYDDEVGRDDSSFMWLQSVDTQNLCFVVIDPCVILREYKPYIPRNIIHKLAANGESDLRYLVLTVIYDDISKSTVNLLSPIVINSRLRTAMQVILEKSFEQNHAFRTKHLLFANSDKSTFALAMFTGSGDGN